MPPSPCSTARSQFTSLGAETQASRRAILEKFRAEYGSYPMATLPQKFVVAALNKMKPFAARNWLKAIRGAVPVLRDARAMPGRRDARH